MADCQLPLSLPALRPLLHLHVIFCPQSEFNADARNSELISQLLASPGLLLDVSVPADGTFLLPPGPAGSHVRSHVHTVVSGYYTCRCSAASWSVACWENESDLSAAGGLGHSLKLRSVSFHPSIIPSERTDSRRSCPRGGAFSRLKPDCRRHGDASAQIQHVFLMGRGGSCSPRLPLSLKQRPTGSNSSSKPH